MASLSKCHPRSVPKITHHFPRKLRVRVQSRTDRGPAQSEFFDDPDCVACRTLSVFDLLRVTAEFLAQPDRSRVHQMSPPDLDHLPKLMRFGFQSLLEVVQRGH